MAEPAACWPRPAASDPCPCGWPAAAGRVRCLAECCGRFVLGGVPPPQGAWPEDAETLMRSRYTAFVCGDVAWLQASWHPRTRPAALALDPAQRWLGLQVRAHLPLAADRAEVEFVARSRDASGRASRLHERSRFVREGGRWLYVDGDLLPR